MTFTAPAFSFGWFLALIILILDVLLKAVGIIDFPVMMVVAAICAVRL